MLQNNVEIRTEIQKRGLRYWQVADLLGIGETTLSRWLRKELPEEKKNLILEVIRKESQGA